MKIVMRKEGEEVLMGGRGRYETGDTEKETQRGKKCSSSVSTKKNKRRDRKPQRDTLTTQIKKGAREGDIDRDRLRQIDRD